MYPETTLSKIEATPNYLQIFTSESIFQYGMNYEVNFQINKHCEILVSCSDEERTACKLRELHASLCNCMQAYVTACKLM